MSFGMLIDTTRCVGCRGCQVACKSFYQLKANKTGFFQQEGGYQNPPKLNAKNFCVITFHEIPKEDGGLRWIMAKRQCMHCKHPACASACPVTALHKTPEGPVTYDAKKCIGCRYCVWACPFGVPTADWDSLAPKIHKCTMCYERVKHPLVVNEINGQPLTEDQKKTQNASQQVPACAKACPTGALKFGDHDELLAEARQRIKDHPDRYVDHIYGEKEAGGTAKFYLASVPFDQIGFRTDLGEKSYPEISAVALKAVSPALMGVGGLLTGVYLLNKRRADVEKAEQGKKE